MKQIRIIPMFLVLFGVAYPHAAQATSDLCTPHCMCLEDPVDVALEGVVEAESDLGSFQMRVTAVHLRDGIGAEQAPAVGDLVEAHYFMGASVGDHVLAGRELDETAVWMAIPLDNQGTLSCIYQAEFVATPDEVIAAWLGNDCYQAAGDLGLEPCRRSSGSGCSVAPGRPLPAGGSLLLLIAGALLVARGRRRNQARHGR